MKHLYSYKLRLKPTTQQEVLLAKHFGCGRFVFNHFLDKRIQEYKTNKKALKRSDNEKELPTLKQEFPWLKEVGSQSLQYAVECLQKAYDNFFRKVKQKIKGKKGFPRFKKRHAKQSFRIKQNIYKYVCFQDESIHAWHSGSHGRKVQSTGIGGILADLKHKAVTPIEVDKFFPSTQLCPACNAKNKHLLSERTYTCGCGYSEDRDLKSAICIEAEGMRRVPTDYREFKPGETSTSTFLDRVSEITGVKVSKLELRSQEAAGLALR